ncbi:hypothetical protein A8L33_12485 [Microbacterium aurantiacum]|uniref:Uncharacterized protein n=1 Tax=Microbacterium aurantiacum TaxID=162393 RepID=A0A0M8MD30_9MICO|nr:hypothetical protein A8L33_12485 [Microbacterium chocolatum]KOS09926.1 hypothetical protein XI38_12775 [Microbacterium chocolatum]
MRVVQHWTPLSQLERTPEPGVWLMFDKSRRIAIVRVVTVRGRRLLRSVTYDQDPEKRVLIGYFPEDALRLAAECTWSEYVRAVGPPTSNRR